jgi:hypothetical protein
VLAAGAILYILSGSAVAWWYITHIKEDPQAVAQVKPETKVAPEIKVVPPKVEPAIKVPPKVEPKKPVPPTPAPVVIPKIGSSPPDLPPPARTTEPPAPVRKDTVDLNRPIAPAPKVEQPPPPEPPAPEQWVFRRRQQNSEEDLRKELLTVPDIGLQQPATAMLYAPLLQMNRRGRSLSGLQPDCGPRMLALACRTRKRWELMDIPWRMGSDCQLGKEPAERLHVLSLNLRACMQRAVPHGDIRPNADNLRQLLHGEWHDPGAIPALMQMLQPENTPIRLLLIDLLSDIKGKEASVCLAQRALYDLSPEVREKAVLALKERPRQEFRQTLLQGFHYPWPAVEDHAAEALIALKDKASIPSLIDMLKEPASTLPFPVKQRQPASTIPIPDKDRQPGSTIPIPDKDKEKEIYTVKELVRIGHMANCMVCHAPSLSTKDLVRGRVPVPDEDPPPLYYAERTGLFVRADTTFLRQDFSVMQPVTHAGKWPGNQRFDYFTRIRPLSPLEKTAWLKKQQETQPPREALLYSLKELTGKNPGSTHEAWKSLQDDITND